MDSLTRLLGVLGHVYPADAAAPVYVRLLRAAALVRAGRTPGDAAAQMTVRPALLTPVLAASDPVEAVFGCLWDYPLTDDKARAAVAAKKNLGQLVLGQISEKVFERIYKAEIGTQDLKLEDDRAGRNDTDYRVLNGQGRRVFRINIKFHGTQFRNAKDLVSLDPEDCFALATYKIHQGLKKQEAETLPYLFVIVSALGLSGESVGDVLPEDIARTLTLVRLCRDVPGMRKRDVEDGLVTYLLGPDAPAEFVEHRSRITTHIEGVPWRVLSARKADKLLRELLFERVFAVRVPRFAQNYRRAELDMHFSLENDLTPLPEFLRIYKEGGLHAITAHLMVGKV